ncbi:hypothetical protein [Nonomuraea indica]|uniref:hypothetical protein n=1 Tax=Nonomuraea indica TaxID=1581193 RepID=UPI001C5ED075|nr:hypothetical protein [Nonomuraea indica]
MRPVRIVVLERALGGDKVPAHQLGQVAGKGAQFVTHLLVQLVGGDVGGDVRQPLPLRRVIPVRPAVPGT